MKLKSYSITQNNRHITIYIAYLGGSTIYPALFQDKPLANKLLCNSSGSVIFDGRYDSGEALRIGIYIIFLEAINEGSSVGFSSSYGNGKIVISAIQTPNKAAADEYFKSTIVPDIDKMKNSFRGNINGKWRASGTDDKGGKWYGWVNDNWVFLLNGSDKKYFKMAIDAFKFVEE